MGEPVVWCAGWYVELVQDAERAITMGRTEEAGEGETVGLDLIC